MIFFFAFLEASNISDMRCQKNIICRTIAKYRCGQKLVYAIKKCFFCVRCVLCACCDIHLQPAGREIESRPRPFFNRPFRRDIPAQNFSSGISKTHLKGAEGENKCRADHFSKIGEGLSREGGLSTPYLTPPKSERFQNRGADCLWGAL